MARVDIPIGTAITTAGTTWTGGTINGTDFAAIQAQGNVHRLLIEVINSGSAGTVIVKEGDNKPAFRAELGDLSLAIPRLGTLRFTVDGSRHVQDTGDIYIDFANAVSGELMAGFVYAVRLANV